MDAVAWVETDVLFDAVHTPGWSVRDARWRERLNEAYRIEVELTYAALDIEPLDLVGRTLSLSLTRSDAEEHVTGIITELDRSFDYDHVIVRAVVEPALAALRKRTDSRVFQQKSVPAILEQVLDPDLRAYGRALRLELDHDYPDREYTVQYRETDFDFVHRLMEEEGIGYYFEHGPDTETLILIDRHQSYPTLTSTPSGSLEYLGRRSGALELAIEGIAQLVPRRRLSGNKVCVRRFDWTHPSCPIESTADANDPGAERESYVHEGPLTLHGYSGTYSGHDAGRQAELLGQLMVRDAERFEGQSSAIGLRAGTRFDLVGHHEPEMNRALVVVEIDHHLGGAQQTSGRAARPQLNSRFVAVDAGVDWRPDRLRDRPRIHGVQTATVVGPAGEEIYTDPHGRVKVQFHWDRLGTRDHHSSCWIRVVQAMGGPGWGFSFIPRIGMEVVITFLDGDPDQPLVTGVVYNGESPPPYDYPAMKTRTTIKTNSSPGGEGFNELRFEDAAGAEEIFLHGQKDWNTTILNDLTRDVGRDEAQQVARDRTRTVGNDETLSVGNDRTRAVGNDETLSVGNDRTRTVGNDESVGIGNDQHVQIGNDQQVQIGNDQSLLVGANQVIQVAEDRSLAVAANHTVEVAADQSTTVGVNDTTAIGADRSANVGGDDQLAVAGAQTVTVGGASSEQVALVKTVSVGGAMQVTVGGALNQSVAGLSAEQVGLVKSVIAGASISMICGASSLTMDAAGNITLKGTAITIDGGTVKVIGDPIDLN